MSESAHFGEARERAGQLVAVCREALGETDAVNVDDLAMVLSLRADWRLESWPPAVDAEVLLDVVRLTRSEGIVSAWAIAAAVVLPTNRYALASLWSERWSYQDLVTIGAAACQRVPSEF